MRSFASVIAALLCMVMGILEAGTVSVVVTAIVIGFIALMRPSGPWIDSRFVLIRYPEAIMLAFGALSILIALAS